MRVFGEGSNLFIDRTQEEKYLKEMTSLGFGLRLEATFSNGRLEVWNLHVTRSLKHAQD